MATTWVPLLSLLGFGRLRCRLWAFHSMHDRVVGFLQVSVAFFEIAGKKCFDLLGHKRREIQLKDSDDGYVHLQVRSAECVLTTTRPQRRSCFDAKGRLKPPAEMVVVLMRIVFSSHKRRPLEID